MRLDKLLANSGYGSRKDVKQLIKNKLVRVNETVVKKADMHINPETDQIICRGEEVHYEQFKYFMLHKPQGVISATVDVEHRTVIDLLDNKDQVSDLFPVGRLDKDTEGLLLLTNDGKLAHNLLSPKKHVDKKYFAKVEGIVTEEDRVAFAKGVNIGDYITKPASLNVRLSADISEVEIIISEGKFHQVKRMFEAVNKKVIYLKRLEMGPLELDQQLPIGKYRALFPEEIQLLKDC